MPDEIDTRNIRDISITANDNGIAAGHIENLNVNVDGTNTSLQTLLLTLQQSGLFSLPVPAPANDPVEIGRLRRDYYNLFVIEDETYQDGSFSISRSDALTRYTHDAEHFRPMTADIISEIESMPCLFTIRNDNFSRCSDNWVCVAGKLSKITVHGSVIKFKFGYYAPAIPQNLLNQNAELFGLATSSLRNELDDEHWAIKKIDLLTRLKDQNYEIR
jgi:hypothetical protein